MFLLLFFFKPVSFFIFFFFFLVALPRMDSLVFYVPILIVFCSSMSVPTSPLFSVLILMLTAPSHISPPPTQSYHPDIGSKKLTRLFEIESHTLSRQSLRKTSNKPLFSCVSEKVGSSCSLYSDPPFCPLLEKKFHICPVPVRCAKKHGVTDSGGCK